LPEEQRERTVPITRRSRNDSRDADQSGETGLSRREGGRPSRRWCRRDDVTPGTYVHIRVSPFRIPTGVGKAEETVKRDRFFPKCAPPPRPAVLLARVRICMYIIYVYNICVCM